MRTLVFTLLLLPVLTHAFGGLQGVHRIENFGRVVVLDVKPDSSGHVRALAGGSRANIHFINLTPDQLSKKEISFKQELRDFFTEASDRLVLADDAKAAPSKDYLEFVKELKIRLEKVRNHRKKISRKIWSRLREEARHDMDFDSENRPEAIEKLTKFIFRQYDPKMGGSTLSKDTIFCPLSIDWFQSNPLLAAYFKKNFIDAEIDLRLYGGSGEGIGWNHHGDFESSNYKDYYSRLLKLKKAVNKMNVDGVVKSPENSWLNSLNEDSVTKTHRMIFIHQNTWKNSRETSNYAEYINIDQDLSTLRSSALLSVLIHELNVNSNGFLAGDTHLPEDGTVAVWTRLNNDTLSRLDAHETMFALAIQPDMTLIYLSYYLDKLSEMVR